jgi:hypothetical protein
MTPTPLTLVSTGVVNPGTDFGLATSHITYRECFLE